MAEQDAGPPGAVGGDDGHTSTDRLAAATTRVEVDANPDVPAVSPTKGAVSVGSIDSFKHAAELADMHAETDLKDLFIEDTIYWHWQSWRIGSGGEFSPDELTQFGYANELMRLRAVSSSPELTKSKVGRKINLTAASGLKARKVYWLWHPWIPRGALTLIAGLPGVGKSQVALDYAARVTRGESDMQTGEPRCVLIYATEDAKEHVIVPRLLAAGADLDYVHFMSVIETDARGVTIGSSLVLPIDQDELAEAIEMVSALLVIFDPLMSVLDPSKSANQDRELRTALEPLAATLDRTRCSGIGLAHFRKAGGSAADRVMGGRGFVGVARSVLVAVPDHEADEIVLSIEKSNYGALGTPGLRYRVATRPVTVEGDDGESEDVSTPYIEWLGETEGDGNETVRDLLDEGPDRARSQIDVAGAWLLGYLRTAGGWAASDEVKAAATGVSISASTLQRARKKHGVLDHTLPSRPLRTVWYLAGVDVSTLTTSVTIAPSATTAPPVAPSVLSDR